MVSKSRFEALKSRSIAARRRLAAASNDDVDAMVSVASAIGVGLYERSGKTLPTILNLDPLIVWGFGAWALTRKNSNRTAQMANTAGIAMATIGVNRSVMRGSIRVGEDDGGEYVSDDDL